MNENQTYVRKATKVEAQQWFQLDDHDAVRQPDKSRADRICIDCGKWKHDHGVMGTYERPISVCPGDWIVKSADGELYSCKPSVFEATHGSETEAHKLKIRQKEQQRRVQQLIDESNKSRI